MIVPREEGIGQFDFTINFSPRFAQLARWSREGTDANRNLEKRFDLDQSSLSLSLHLENTLPPVSYLSFVTISLSNRIYTSSSTLNYSVEGNSMSKARQLPRRILSRLETTKLIARPSTRSSVSTVLFSDSFGIFLLLGPRWHGARVL